MRTSALAGRIEPYPRKLSATIWALAVSGFGKCRLQQSEIPAGQQGACVFEECVHPTGVGLRTVHQANANHFH